MRAFAMAVGWISSVRSDSGTIGSVNSDSGDVQGAGL